MPKDKNTKRKEALTRVEKKLIENANLLSAEFKRRWGYFEVEKYLHEANIIRGTLGYPSLTLDRKDIVKHRGLSSLRDWPFTFDTPTPPKVKKSGDVYLFVAGLFFIVTILGGLGWFMYYL